MCLRLLLFLRRNQEFPFEGHKLRLGFLFHFFFVVTNKEERFILLQMFFLYIFRLVNGLFFVHNNFLHIKVSFTNIEFSDNFLILVILCLGLMILEPYIILSDRIYIVFINIADFGQRHHLFGQNLEDLLVWVFLRRLLFFAGLDFNLVHFYLLIVFLF